MAKLVSILALFLVVLTAGCKNEAEMEPGSSMLLTDEFGNQYLVKHSFFEVYRVVKMPTRKDQPNDR